MKRITARDQRAVVMRCTATKTTPACESAAKKSQFAWKALQARSGVTIAAVMKAIAPTIASTRKVSFTAEGIGLLEASNTCSRVRTRGGCKLTVVVSDSSYRACARRARCRAQPPLLELRALLQR